MKNECVGNIYETNDYSLFKKLKNNRIVSEQRFNRLMKSFKGGALLIPIIVNKDYEIIDGQARFEVRKRLMLPIPYIMIENATVEDCRRINYANAPWKVGDFVASFANSGNENYVRLAECSEITGLKYPRILKLASAKGCESEKSDNIKSGDLVFTEENKEKVLYMVKRINEIKEALGEEDRTNDAFWNACKISMETDGYDHARMIRLCSKYRMSYSQQSRLEDQLKMFSTIYNRGKSKTNLYFEDYMRNKGYNIRDYGSNNFPVKDMDISSLE